MIPGQVGTGDISIPLKRFNPEQYRYDDNLLELWGWFALRHIPVSILEKRVWDWITDVHIWDFLDRIDDLILNGTRDQWDAAFLATTDAINVDTDLTDNEWIEILQLQNKKRWELILSLDDANEKLAHAKRRLKEVLIGSGLFALIAGLSMAYISREKDVPVSSSPVAPSVQSVPDEAEKILEQIRKLLDESSSVGNIREL
jgi:hypothetical protein